MALTPNNLILYHFNSCPYCIKVRLACKLYGIELSQRNILREAKYKKELIAGGGKKQVPCLRIERENGAVEWLYESSDIIHYLKTHCLK